MKVVADLHLHSKYSRAVSSQMNLENMASWAIKKGINILATSDWTHPLWFSEISQKLEENGSGLLRLKSAQTQSATNEEQSVVSNNSLSAKPNALSEVYFLLSCEISSIYSQGGKVRRIHNLVFVPSLSTAEKINKKLKTQGANLRSDGRPIIGISAKYCPKASRICFGVALIFVFNEPLSSSKSFTGSITTLPSFSETIAFFFSFKPSLRLIEIGMLIWP